jgi:hypothetical protein
MIYVFSKCDRKAVDLRQAASLLLCFLLLCPQVPAQGAPQGQEKDALNLTKPDAKRAQKAAERGARAEAAGLFDDALAYYDEAARYAPFDVIIVSKGAALRSRLVREHVEAGERQALAGNLLAATEELAAALRIDPANTIVQERLGQMRAMEDATLAKQDQTIEGLPRVQPQLTKHSFNLRTDSKSAYEQVAAAFGIKAAFDPDLVARDVRLRVGDVDFYTAMSLLAAETATFWRPLNATLIFVAPGTLEKRRQYGLEAEQTFPLPAGVGPEEMTELLRVLREITAATKIELNSGSRSITMRDTPEKLALAASIIRDVERARGEVLLEIELLEVDRGKASKLGITPPSSTQLLSLNTQDVRSLQQATDLTNLLTKVAQIFAAKGFSSIPSVALLGGGLSTFLLTLPGAAADFSDSLSLVHSGRQILLRAQDGKPATFFVGDRYPVTLSQLSASLGTTTLPTGTTTSTTFPENTYNVGNTPAGLVARDFDGDGKPDLAIVNELDNSISILKNNGDGTFTPAKNSPFVYDKNKNESGPIAIASGIFRDPTTSNPNPAADLIIANSTSNNVTVLLGNGDGTFTEAAGSPYPVGKSPKAIVVADFNGDGKLDFAVANAGDNSISVFKGDGTPAFKEFPASPFVLSANEKGPVALVSANFRNKSIGPNNLSEADLAVVNQTTNNVSILLGSLDSNQNPIFTEAPNSPITVGTFPVAIAAGDLNVDGIPDLAVLSQGNSSTNEAASIAILLGSSSANGTFVASTQSPLPAAVAPAGIVIADFSADGIPDLAVTNEGPSTLSIYLGLGSGTYASRIELSVPSIPGPLVTADFNGDGLPDVALTSQASGATQGTVTVVLDSSRLPSAVTSLASQPYPASEYIDLGVKVKATPVMHSNNEVTLQLEIEIKALSGSSVNGIPIISNRSLTQTVRVKEDETTLLGGLLDKEETRAITGLPGFAEVPGVGYAFGGRNNSLQDRELLILVTPRKMRLASRDSRFIFAGRGDTGSRGSVGATVPPGNPEP